MNRKDIDSLAVSLVALEEKERREYAGDLLQLYADVVGVFPPVRREQLEKVGLAGVSTRQFLHLAPVRDTETWLPVMSVVNAANPTNISLQVALFAGKSIRDQSLGFRFESPEGEALTNEFGLHNFYHVQLCTVLRPSERRASSIPWLPVTQPSVPLDATDATSLFAAMMLALYGTKILRFIYDALGELPASVTQMTSISLQPRYWKVTPKRGTAIIYKTTVGQHDAQSLLQARHAGAQIEQCTAAVYRDADDAARKQL